MVENVVRVKCDGFCCGEELITYSTNNISKSGWFVGFRQVPYSLTYHLCPNCLHTARYGLGGLGCATKHYDKNYGVQFWLFAKDIQDDAVNRGVDAP